MRAQHCYNRRMEVRLFQLNSSNPLEMTPQGTSQHSEDSFKCVRRIASSTREVQHRTTDFRPFDYALNPSA